MYIHEILYCFLQTSLEPKQNGCIFAGNIFKCVFLNENYCILIIILIRFIPMNLTDIMSINCFRKWLGTEQVTSQIYEPMLTEMHNIIWHQYTAVCKRVIIIDGIVQNCSNSTANALELLQSCTKLSIFMF